MVFLETKEYQLFEVKEVQPVYVSVCSLTLTNEKSASFKASGVVAEGGGGQRGQAPPTLEIEICRKCLEILRLSEKLVDHQLKIIRSTMMTYFSTW